jgi:general secretion pathway protein C
MAAPPAPAPAAAEPPVVLSPRMAGGRVTGVTVAPGGDGQAFRAAGFEAGDVVVAVNGQRITSLEQAQAVIRQGGGQVMVMVERGGRAVPLRVRLSQ